jgi:AsmA protein
MRRVEGKGDIAFSIEGSGHSVLGITRTLVGQATLASRKGALTGINIEQLLRRLERRPLSSGSAFRTGRTPYDRLTITLKVAQGTVTVEEMKIEGNAIQLALTGSASIPARDLDLKGTASLASTNPGTAPFELPFAVAGSWDDPHTRFDVQSLIRRSGAAAPLLDAVRSHRAREAVRNAIDRLTGSVPAPTAAPAETPAATEPAASEPPKAQ